MNEQVFDPSKPAGYQIPRGPRDWYTYQALFANVTAGAAASLNIPIEADSDFYLTAMTYQAQNDTDITTYTAEATNPIPLVTVLLTDSGSGRQLMSGPIPIPAIMGDGKHPYRLIHPRLFKRTSNIQVAIQSYDIADYDSLYLVFHGFKQYGVG